jgi:hypothetical protein
VSVCPLVRLKSINDGKILTESDVSDISIFRTIYVTETRSHTEKSLASCLLLKGLHYSSLVYVGVKPKSPL